MKIKDMEKVILQFRPDGVNPATIERKLITLSRSDIQEAFEIGKENLNRIFEKAKAMVNSKYLVSDFLKHDRIRYFEKHNGDCYVIGFDVDEDSMGEQIMLKFYQSTNIPELNS